MSWKNYGMRLIWYSELGRGKVIARSYGMIPEILMVMTFLKVYGVKLSIPFIIGFIIIAYLISIFLGRWYAKNGYLEIETELSNKYNPTLQKIAGRK